MLVVRTNGFRFYAAQERRAIRRATRRARVRATLRAVGVMTGIIVAHAAVLLALQSLYWSLVS